MTTEKLTELLKIAYRCGRDNGSNRSEKNFNDLLQTEEISQALRIRVGYCCRVGISARQPKQQLKV